MRLLVTLLTLVVLLFFTLLVLIWFLPALIEVVAVLALGWGWKRFAERMNNE